MCMCMYGERKREMRNRALLLQCYREEHKITEEKGDKEMGGRREREEGTTKRERRDIRICVCVSMEREQER